MLALFIALRLEYERFRRHLDAQYQEERGGYSVTVGQFRGKPLLICQTGIGRRAEEAAKAVIERCRPWVAVSLGFSGALSPDVRVGELIFCEQVYSGEGKGSPAGSRSVRSDRRLLMLARQAAARGRLPARTGTSLTMPYLVATAAEKARLRRRLGPDVAEMESFWVGSVAEARDVPFLAVRVISDGPRDPVPDIPGIITREGSQHPWRVAPYVLRHPTQFPLLLRLACQERRAGDHLTKFCQAFVEAFDPLLFVRR